MPCPPIYSRAFACTLLAPPSPAALRSAGPHLAPHRMPSFRLGSTQGRSTSRWVLTPLASQTCATCSTCAPSRVLPSNLQSSPPLHAACTAVACRPLVYWPAPRHASYAVLPARQSATAFNQPLTFDTSSVTDMSWMFRVRPQHVPCAAVVCPPRVSRPAPRPASYALSSRLGSAQECSTSR